GQTLALAVRSVGATGDGALVRLDAQPSEHLEDPGFGAGLITLPVGVLESEHEAPAVALREDVVEQTYIGGPDMRITRWGRRYASNDLHGVASLAVQS